jgi:hypothetical protein
MKRAPWSAILGFLWAGQSVVAADPPGAWRAFVALRKKYTPIGGL